MKAFRNAVTTLRSPLCIWQPAENSSIHLGDLCQRVVNVGVIVGVITASVSARLLDNAARCVIAFAGFAG
jgi:hypothetical protein